MKGKIDKVSIDEIINYYENPRHAIGSDENDTLKKLFDAVGIQYMLNLAEDILTHGFLGCQQVTIVYAQKINKYIVYEGNRRVACVKMLKNPDKFTFLDNATIIKAKTLVQGKNINDLELLDCYITDEEEALFIMERLHSGEDKGRGIKQWTSREKEIFKVRQNNTKSLSYLVDFYIKKYFDEYDITSILPFTTIQRIFNNREVKKVVAINVNDEETFTKDRMQMVIDTSKWIIRKAEKQGIAATRLFNKSRDIENEVIPWLNEYQNNKEKIDENYEEILVIGADQLKENNLTNNNIDQNQSDTIKNKQIETEQENGVKNPSEIESGNFNDLKSTEENLSIDANTNDKGNGGSGNLPYFFQGIRYGHLNPNDSDTHGITRVCREIQVFSSKKLVDTLPMSATFLIRSVIEQSLIFYSKRHNIQGQNRTIWTDISSISKLSKIVDKYNKNLPNYITDTNMREYFTDIFGNYQENVNPLNWVVHRPYEYQLDSKTLIDLPKKGLLTLINFLIS